MAEKILIYKELRYVMPDGMIRLTAFDGTVFESTDFHALMQDYSEWYEEHPAPEQKQEKKVDKLRIIQMIVSFVGIAAIIVFALCSIGF